MNFPRIYTIFFSLFFIFLNTTAGCIEHQQKPFPAGYIDSPFVVPDGSALYFIHSVAATIDMLKANPFAQPITKHLNGHVAKDGDFWWNTDIFVSYKNSDGTWGEPVNLGKEINSLHLEGSPWVNNEQTILFFGRESVDGGPENGGSYISRRKDKDSLWGKPEKLPGKLGDFSGTGFGDFHLTKSGDLYYWTEASGNGELYYSKALPKGGWGKPTLLPDYFLTSKNETQPWINESETVLYFNRRGNDGNTSLHMSQRPDTKSPWGKPKEVSLSGFADKNGLLVWGEPSFDSQGRMYFVRFDTAQDDWDAEIFWAHQEKSGGFASPTKITFKREKLLPAKDTPSKQVPKKETK